MISLWPRRLSVAAVLALSSVATRAAETDFVKKTLTYKTVGELEIRADVHRADDDTVRPVLVWIHGGALVMGSREGVPRDLRELCRAEGYILVSLDYRLAPEVKIGVIIEDLRDALRWIRERGPGTFGADPERIVVSGGSAGGYLTMMAGVAVEPGPTALVAYWGYGDVDGEWYTKPSPHYTSLPLVPRDEALRAVGGGVITGTTPANGRARGRYYLYLRQNGLWTREVTGLDPEKDTRKLDAFCPLRRLTSRYPPILMVHGTEDRDVPYEKSADMARELARHGVAHELVTVQGGGHGLGGADPRAVEEARRRARAFVKRHLRKKTPEAGKARVLFLSPATIESGEEDFERVASSLRPGDRLVLKEGVYSQTGRRAITCKGTAESPIVIEAEKGAAPVLTRPRAAKHRYRHNGLEVVDSEHLILRGLRFRGGSSGIRFIRGRNITLEDCEVFETGNNAITLNSGDTQGFVIRRNHLHHTGLLDSSVGETEGEGMYIGGNNNSVTASGHLIEGNYIHHLRSTSGGGNDGIEIKVGSHGNIVRHNVIHDTNIGKRYPGITVYGVSDPRSERPNVVDGNVIWNAGEGIFVVSDAVVRNNIVFHCDSGIAAYRHGQVRELRNVKLVHNTVAGHRGAAVRIRWGGARGMVLANNAIFGFAGDDRSVAMDARGLEGTAIVSCNVVDNDRTRIRRLDAGEVFAETGGLRSWEDFDLEQISFWPAVDSPLRGGADPTHAPAEDFNGRPRRERHDVGAYGTGGEERNEGWKIAPGFKPLPRG